MGAAFALAVVAPPMVLTTGFLLTEKPRDGRLSRTELAVRTGATLLAASLVGGVASLILGKGALASLSAAAGVTGLSVFGGVILGSALRDAAKGSAAVTDSR